MSGDPSRVVTPSCDPAAVDAAKTIRVATDLTLDGQVGDEWVCIWPEGIGIATSTAAKEYQRCYLTAGITGYRTVAGIGSGVLQAQIEGVWVNLVRYSNRWAHRFGRLAARLEES